MDIYVLNKNFETIKIVDGYSSLVWADRYNELGDFELEIGFDSELIQFLKEGNYISILDSESLMLIEDIETVTDNEDGPKLRVTGKSAESILQRRIMWDSRIFTSVTLSDFCEIVINESIINPYLEERKIKNFIYERNPRISNKYILDIEADAENTIYDVIQQASDLFDVGFKVRLRDGYFVFSLYEGMDRSYDQTDRPMIFFSPRFDNILSGDYLKSTSNYKNVAKCDYIMPTVNPITGAEGELNGSYYLGSESGLNRREIGFTFEDPEIPESIYLDYENIYSKSLFDQAKATLKENSKTEIFDGDIEPYGIFLYGRDFFIGDIVQVEDEFGHTAKSRVIEVIISEDDSGRSVIPTFEKIDGTDYTIANSGIAETPIYPQEQEEVYISGEASNSIEVNISGETNDRNEVYISGYPSS